MVEPLLRRLATFDEVSEGERQILREAVSRTRTFEAHQDIVGDGDRPNESNLVLEGFATRYTLLTEGRRQITAIHVPGDFVDLHSLLLRTMDHSVASLTRCTIAIVPHDTLRRITREQPHLTRLLWLLTLVDASIHREWITSLGRRSALGQVARLICEIYRRLEIVGLARELRFDLPLTQSELGDTLGLSTVHVNRVVQELRASGLLRWRGREVVILDWDSLAAVAEFDPTFLHVGPEPR